MAPNNPPAHTINLSLPPHTRYTALATEYALILRGLPDLYSEAVSHLPLPASFFHLLGRLLLRRLHSTEQTSELRGISSASGIPMYLLIAYNVFLDLLMDCTSGGAMTHDPRLAASATMLHFRTLDWSMTALQDLIVQYEFVEREDGEVVARTLGPSIAAVVRGFLLPREAVREKKVRRRLAKRREGEHEEQEQGEKSLSFSVLPPYTASDVINLLPHKRTSVAYRVFCTGTETIILEKDFQTARTLRSSSFISTTNHDVALETAANPQATQQHSQSQTNPFLGASMQEVLDESIDRKQCLSDKWQKWIQQQGRKAKRGQPAAAGVSLRTLIRWVEAYPVCNAVTHFACIMDPREGMFRWVKRFGEGEIVDVD